jgi:hypothetical protein
MSHEPEPASGDTVPPTAKKSQQLTPQEAFSLLLAMDQPLGTDLRSLIEEGRRA